MQSHDWNDLKFLLALERTETHAAAARALGTSDTTVARRIRALERDLGVRLFVRSPAGRHVMTDIGHRILGNAEAAERENVAIREAVGQSGDALTGQVRVSSVPIIINRVLVPNLAGIRHDHPGLTLELVPDARNLDLSKREADLAIRFARPATGGLRIKAQKLGSLAFGAFGPASRRHGEPQALPWIDYDDAHASLPQARWLAAAALRGTPSRAAVRVSDAETALEAVAHGLGRTILPKIVGEPDRRLRPLPEDEGPSPPAREVWLLAHVDQGARATLSAVKAWLMGLPWR